MTIRYDYDADYAPAAPVVKISLSLAGEVTAAQEIQALLDSGADATMIPLDVLAAAGARYVERRQMRGVTGEAVAVNLYLITVHIGPYTVHGIRAVGAPPGSEVVLGRDLLNQLEVTLDGPAQETRIR